MSKLSKKELHQIAKAAANSGTKEKVTAKRYLSTIRRMDDAIARRKDELARLRMDATGMSGISYDSDKVQSSGGNDRMAKKVSAYVDIEKELERDIASFSRTRLKVIREIEQLENEDYCELLYKRYLKYEPLETISEEMGYTYEYTRRLHGKALQAFERRYKKLHLPVL